MMTMLLREDDDDVDMLFIHIIITLTGLRCVACDVFSCFSGIFKNARV